MKRIFALLLTLLLAVGMAACGAEKAAVPAPETQSAAAVQSTAAAEETTLATTEETTQPAPDKILEPSFKGMENQGPNTTSMIQCTVEAVDDATIRVNLYQRALYAKEDVLSLQEGELLGILCDGQMYEATVVKIQEGNEEDIQHYVQMDCSGKTLLFGPETDGEMGEGELIGFSAVFPPADYFLGCFESVEAAADSIEFKEYVYEEVGGDYELNKFTGAQLIQRLKEKPEVFQLGSIGAAIRNGRLEYLMASIYPS